MARASVAVLPFDNLGRDEATGRLADGITEDIITVVEPRFVRKPFGNG